MMALDTNVLVRLLLRDDAAQARAAEQFVASCQVNDESCLISQIVVVEAVWVLETAYGYSRDQIAKMIEYILLADALSVEEAHQVWAALRDFRASRADFADCLIGRTNQALGSERTVTFDRIAARLETFQAL